MSDIEAKLDEILELQRLNAQNIVTLYRRTTALAHMVEAIAHNQEPQLPKVLRAEIDASINVQAFESLARHDKDEFVHRYGQAVLDTLQNNGVDAIARIGDFAPLKNSERLN